MLQHSSSDEIILAHTRTWLEKAIIGLNLCPFAKAVYAKNQVKLIVSHARHLDGFLEDLDRELLFLANCPPEETDTSLLIHPRLFEDFLLFNDMMELADQAIIDNQLEGVIQLAPFHPEFQFEGTNVEDISNYTNRSPYPTLHLIRESSIDKALTTMLNPDSIFERNIALLEEMGHEGWATLGLPSSK
ncbi:DUF1415 domain-containing protein [Neisseria sp. Ec49-e6-T10]|uniref:DUF1415 domain-containing protein n=1 Tax=Neisseria sp. Ec49-e6-T10 TaxID=3140744 RepID=UPI003EB8456B